MSPAWGSDGSGVGTGRGQGGFLQLAAAGEGPRGTTERAGGCRGAEPAPAPQEKVSQLKDEVRLQYEKMHQILDEDLRKTMEILDKAQAKFCNENAAQVLHLNERMQEAKKLLSSVQVMFDKTEDINFMKVSPAAAAGRVWCRGDGVGARRGAGDSTVSALLLAPEGSGRGGVDEDTLRMELGWSSLGCGDREVWGSVSCWIWDSFRTGRAAGGMRPRCLEAGTALGAVGDPEGDPEGEVGAGAGPVLTDQGFSFPS